MAWTPPTPAEVDSYFDTLNNWNRWGAAVLSWDMHDEQPVGYGDLGFGVHLAIPILGLCLIDNTYPERLVEACAAEGRNEFLYIATPLRLVGGTGCPVQPLAIF